MYKKLTFSYLIVLILASTGFLKADTPIPPTMTAGAPMSVGMRYPSAAGYTRNDSAWLYIMGGLQDGNVISSACYRYNVKADSWESIAPLPMGPDWIGAGVRLGNKIYNLGGTNALFLNNCQTWVQVYDVVAGTWSMAAPMPYGRVYQGAAAYQDSLIYVAGGWGYPAGFAYNDVYVYNVFLNSWRPCTSMNAPRCGGAFAVAGDTLVYVCGGMDWVNPAMRNIVYRGVISASDKSVITWDTTAATYPPGARSSIYGASWGNKGIVVSGGYSFASGNATNECYVYSPGANVWTAMPTLLGNKTDHGAASVFMGSAWKFISATGTSSRGGANSTTVNILTDTMLILGVHNQNNGNVPNEFALHQNYPNPFNPVTKIQFDVPARTNGIVNVAVFNSLGQQIAILVNESLNAGSYTVSWDASNFPSGVYFCRMKAGDFAQTIKLSLVK